VAWPGIVVVIGVAVAAEGWLSGRTREAILDILMMRRIISTVDRGRVDVSFL
jgi:hypothetical protein